jgi:hypothetical protein
MPEDKLLPMKILNFDRVGQKILEWSQDSNLAPKSMDDFRSVFDGLVDVPERFKKLVVVQGDDETFVLRLPPKNQAKQSMEEIKVETNDISQYGIEDMYWIIERPDDFERFKFFHSRVADYTIRGCR